MPSEKSRDLLLLRHAKSSWDDPLLDDFDRPLSKRGRRAARRIAEWLAESGIRPALVLCSTAVRTRQTLDLIQPQCGPEAVVQLERSLYLASADDLVDRLRAVEDDVRSILVIGHNPGLHELALQLAPPRGRKALADKFPTAAIAWFRISGAWSSLDRGVNQLLAYKRPVDLDA